MFYVTDIDAALAELRGWLEEAGVLTFSTGHLVFWVLTVVIVYKVAHLVFGLGKPATRLVPSRTHAEAAAADRAAEAAAAAARPREKRDMTRAELALYDGTHAEVGNRIYLSCKGTIFDVTDKPGFYGPGAGYAVFTARDSSWGLAKTQITADDGDLNTLSLSERDTLDQWYQSYEDKYHVVGRLLDFE